VCVYEGERERERGKRVSEEKFVAQFFGWGTYIQ
jgi:predicted transcriptional regulator